MDNIQVCILAELEMTRVMLGGPSKVGESQMVARGESTESERVKGWLGRADKVGHGQR